jgi:hypothetical protein
MDHPARVQPHIHPVESFHTDRVRKLHLFFGDGESPALVELGHLLSGHGAEEAALRPGPCWHLQNQSLQSLRHLLCILLLSGAPVAPRLW